MTDTTAFTAQMGCLLFGVLSLRERRHAGACLALSLALGIFAYTVREAALAAPSRARRMVRGVSRLESPPSEHPSAGSNARLRRRFLRLAA